MIDNEITVLIVAYKSDKIILKNLENLNNFNIIIVDNYKNSNLFNKIDYFPNIKYIKNNNNLGEAGGAEVGLELINSKYTLYLNPDTLIDENNILKLKNIFLRYDNTGVLTPLHFNEKNQFIPNYFIHPFIQKISRNNFQKKIYESLHDLKPVGDFFPTCVWGAPLFFNTQLIKKIGFFDKNFFLFFEDVDFCDRVIKNNLKIVMTPDSICHHLNQEYSSKSISYLYLTSSNFIFSQMYYFNKNNKKILFFYLRGFEYFLNFIIYLFKLNKNKSLQNLFRLCGILKFTIYIIKKKSNLNFI